MENAAYADRKSLWDPARKLLLTEAEVAENFVARARLQAAGGEVISVLEDPECPTPRRGNYFDLASAADVFATEPTMPFVRALDRWMLAFIELELMRSVARGAESAGARGRGLIFKHARQNADEAVEILLLLVENAAIGADAGPNIAELLEFRTAFLHGEISLLVGDDDDDAVADAVADPYPVTTQYREGARETVTFRWALQFDDLLPYRGERQDIHHSALRVVEYAPALVPMPTWLTTLLRSSAAEPQP